MNKTTTMLKYNIKEKFDALRFNERGEKIKAFAETAGITPRTLYNYFDIGIDSNKDIPAEILFKIASFFHCPVKELVNYEFEVI